MEHRRKGILADAVPGQNQELPESTEITAPKHNWDSLKSLSYAMITVLWLQPMSICFTKTNDLISTDFVSVDPALGFEFGYTDLVFCACGWATKISNNWTTPKSRLPISDWFSNTRHPGGLCLN
jgi:hypothetical protein